MKKKIIIGIIAIVIIVIGIFVFLNTDSSETTRKVSTEESSEIRKLYVVTSPWKPFMYEEDGEYKGLAVELLDRIMTELDIPYTFELLPWTRALKLVELGEADAALTATYSPERALYVYFTPEQIRYAEEGGEIPESTLVAGEFVFFVRKLVANSFRFESGEQVVEDEYRVGINQSYIYTVIPTDDPNLITEEFVDEEEGILALMEGGIDVFLAEKLVGTSVLKDVGLEDEVTYIEHEKGEGIFPEYILFSKNSDYPYIQQLVEDVDRVIIELKRSGEYDKIYNKYLLN